MAMLMKTRQFPNARIVARHLMATAPLSANIATIAQTHALVAVARHARSIVSPLHLTRGLKMAKQFEPVDCSRGAPMGRSELTELPTEPRSVRVFRVRLDSGGYDDGGVYWGLESRGALLYCATDGAGYRMFCRAESRLTAIVELRLARHLLRAGVPEYARLREKEVRGVLGAGGVILRQRLNELGF